MHHRVLLVMALTRSSRICYRTQLGDKQSLVEGIILGTICQEYVVLVTGTAASVSSQGDGRRLGSASYVRVRVAVGDVRVMEAQSVLSGLAEQHDSAPVPFPIPRGEALDAALPLFGDSPEDYLSMTDGESPRAPSGTPGSTPSPDSFVDLGQGPLGSAGDPSSAAVLALLREIREEGSATAARVETLESALRPVPVSA